MGPKARITVHEAKRMLAAQAEIESLPIASNDVALDAFGIARVW